MWRVETRRLAGRKCANSCSCVCDGGRSLRAVSRARQGAAAFEWSRLARRTLQCLGDMHEVLQLNKMRERKPALRASKPGMVGGDSRWSYCYNSRRGRTWEGGHVFPSSFLFLCSSLHCSFLFFRDLMIGSQLSLFAEWEGVAREKVI
jgi:hypothetical protein